MKIMYMNKFKLIIGGGGFRGFFLIGFNKYLNQKKLKSEIIEYIGVSAGTILNLLIVSDVPYFLIEIIYNELKKCYEKRECILKKIQYLLNKYLPNDIHKLLNRKNYKIIVSELYIFGFRKKVSEKIESKSEVIDYICASCNIPFVTNKSFPPFFKVNNKYYLDGGFTDILPIDSSSAYPQLVVNLLGLKYNFYKSYFPIENLSKIKNWSENMVYKNMDELKNSSSVNITCKPLNSLLNLDSIFWIDSKKKLRNNLLFYTSFYHIVAFLIITGRSKASFAAIGRG